MRMNAFGNAMNPHQGKTKKVLCVCSAGLLRSPTAAVVLSQEPYNYNTRACGVSEEYALIPVTDLLIHWADEIVFMDKGHLDVVRDRIPEGKVLKVLNIADIHPYRSPALVNEIKVKYDNCIKSIQTEYP